MKQLKVYVAGPYTKGDVAVNVRNAIGVADMLMGHGYIPYVPHLTHFWHMLHPRAYMEWMDLDCEWLKVCDVIWVMPGDSIGTDTEVAYAKKIGIPVVRTMEQLEELASLK